MKNTLLAKYLVIAVAIFNSHIVLAQSTIDLTPLFDIKQELPLDTGNHFEPATRLESPQDVAFFKDGRIAVVDNSLGHVRVCEPDGLNCYWVGADAIDEPLIQPPSAASGYFSSPAGLTTNDAGKVFVGGFYNGEVHACDAARDDWNRSAFPVAPMEVCQSYSGKDIDGNQVIESADDIAILSSGRLVVADGVLGRIFILDGKTLKPISSFGFANFNPEALAVDSMDRIIIGDVWGGRILICDELGTCDGFGSYGTNVGQFDAPLGLDVDNSGKIWIADANNDRIQVCSYDGQCTAYDKFEDPYISFNHPSSIAFGPNETVAIVSSVGQSGNIARVFKITSTNPPPIDPPSPPDFVMINEGMNDAWYNPLTDGQGFFISVFPKKQVVTLAWYTYDTFRAYPDAHWNLGHPGHRWLTAQGTYYDDYSHMTITLVSGGQFDQASSIDRESYGTILLTFSDCNNGEVEYNIPAINQTGVIPITRVADDNIEWCEIINDELQQ